jgi:hypothetical protein
MLFLAYTKKPLITQLYRPLDIAHLTGACGPRWPLDHSKDCKSENTRADLHNCKMQGPPKVGTADKVTKKVPWLYLNCDNIDVVTLCH